MNLFQSFQDLVAHGFVRSVHGVALATGGGQALGGRWARWAGLGVLSAALVLGRAQTGISAF